MKYEFWRKDQKVNGKDVDTCAECQGCSGCGCFGGTSDTLS